MYPHIHPQALLLEEIVNPPCNTTEGVCEVSFLGNGFRPLVERTTSIEIFQRILKPADKKVDA
jgi:hypothetical protein